MPITLKFFIVSSIEKKVRLRQKNPHLLAEDGDLTFQPKSLHFGGPAVQSLTGPVGFASPGCPGFAFIGYSKEKILMVDSA